MADDKTTFGEYLAQLRRRHHPRLTQAQLAAKVNEYLGEDDSVTPQAVGNWETNRNRPSRRNLRALELVHELPAGTLTDVLEPLNIPPLDASSEGVRSTWLLLQRQEAEVARLAYELEEAIRHMRDLTRRLEDQVVLAEGEATLRQTALAIELLSRVEQDVPIEENAEAQMALAAFGGALRDLPPERRRSIRERLDAMLDAE